MIALFCLIFVAGVAVAQGSFAGVDPNTLSCDPRGQEFLLLPSFDDCTKYYQCDHGREVAMPGCPEPLIFDFELQTCNWRWATECILRTKPNEGGGDADEDVEGSGDFDEATELNWLQENLVEDRKRVARAVADEMKEVFAPQLDCSLAEVASRHVSFKGDCQRFWRCVGGTPQTFYCSDGLFFNEASQTCDFEANVRCVEAAEDELGQEFIVYK